jgi:plastocyanin
MKHTTLILGSMLLAAAVAACGGGYGGGSSYSPPGTSPGAPPGGVGAMTIGFALPSGAIGTINTSFGLIGGYTQSVYSQVIAFPPGTTVTLKNLSSTTQHTLNVLSMSSFPASATLDTSASGGSTLTSTYRSGTMNPGATTTLTLANAGTYFIGCAFHYMDNPSMRGIIEVSSSATPGPQATPQPNSGGGGGGGNGY